MAATPRAPHMTPRRSTARRGRMGPQADRAAGLRRGGAQDERAASDNSAQKNSADERLTIARIWYPKEYLTVQTRA